MIPASPIIMPQETTTPKVKLLDLKKYTKLNTVAAPLVLWHLYCQPTRTASITDISKAIGTSTAALTTTIAKLHKLRLVHRATSLLDRRVQNVTLLDKSLKYIDAAA